MKINLTSTSAQKTMEIGQELIRVLPNGTTILLLGDLGAGKTTMVRGMAQALNIKEVVQSPTFNIMKIYFKGDRPLIHIDAYRLKDINQDIGLDEYIGYESGITVIEWPEFIEEPIPEESVKVSLFHKGDDIREIVIEGKDELLKGVSL